jgi:2-succinyl-5-enolpyruvyl-6-hydroxy-3-cyclohexene-1-carboxylate synthase
VLAAQRRPALALTTILDERSAAFYALGVAQASRRPVALLCTSGSAPGHWMPAVIEAHASGVPLVLLTADRPASLRAWGANQTIDQTRLFGVFVREFHDPGDPDDSPDALRAMRALGARAAAVSEGRRPGPVHVNLSFPEPLVPAVDCEAVAAATDAPVAEEPAWQPAAEPPRCRLEGRLAGRGLIVCGPGTASVASAEPIWRCAERLAVPTLVDPLSGLRFGPAEPARIARYDSLLRNPDAARQLRPDWVLRFGSTPVSKTLLEWLRGTPSILVDPRERWCDPTHDVHSHVDADPGRFCEWLAGSGLVEPDRRWLARWGAAERRIDVLSDEYLDRANWCEPHVIRTLLGALPPHTALFSGNSLPIRQIDTWAGSRPAPVPVYGNRGVSGIDGNLSTLAGLNRGGVPTLGLVGDLTFFHDLGGLLLMDRCRLPVVVINNGGGRIFDYLPQRDLPGFDALWRTPVSLDIEKLAAAFGVPYRKAASAGTFARALEETVDAARAGVIEVCVEADVSRAVHATFWSLVREESLVAAK